MSVPICHTECITMGTNSLSYSAVAYSFLLILAFLKYPFGYLFLPTNCTSSPLLEMAWLDEPGSLQTSLTYLYAVGFLSQYSANSSISEILRSLFSLQDLARREIVCRNQRECKIFRYSLQATFSLPESIYV